MKIEVLKIRKFGNIHYQVYVFGLLHGCKLQNGSVTKHEYKTFHEVKSKIDSLYTRFPNVEIRVNYGHACI